MLLIALKINQHKSRNAEICMFDEMSRKQLTFHIDHINDINSFD